MATIIEGAVWTLTPEAAKVMEENCFIKECKAEEEHRWPDVLDIDKPVYHIHPMAPDWFGASTMVGSILLAEKEVGRLAQGA